MKFEPGSVYIAWNGKNDVGTFTSAQAEQMSDNPIYRGIRWEKIESITLPIPEGVKAKKDKPDKKTGVKDERITEPSPADGQNQ